MSERRALLDTEMYKISEEDSQDEEVLSAGGLASYTEDLLRLGARGRDDITTTQFRGAGGPWKTTTSIEHDFMSGVSSCWTSEGAGNNNYAFHHPSYPVQETSTSFSSAMHRFGGGNVGSSRYKILKGVPPPPSSVHPDSSKNSKQTSHFASEPGENVDWPETSTNSDSCLSGEERKPSKKKQGASGSGIANSSKFLSKTYFGDHIVKQVSNERSEENSLNVQNHADLQNSNYQMQTDNRYGHQNQRRNYQSRSRRTRAHHHHRQPSANNQESSGSNCSDDNSDDDECDRSPCADCMSASNRRSGSGTGHLGRGDVGDTSSEEGDDYESSYSDESSYGDEEDVYDDFYDDEDEACEYFDDIVRFLSDGEMESSTNPDGDLFLIEYSGESEVSESESNQYFDHPQPHHENSLDTRMTSQSTTDLVDGGVKGGRRDAIEKEGLHGTNDASIPHHKGEAEQGQSVPTTTGQSAGDSLTSSASGVHFKKSRKGAKGKISRLLKIKRDTSKKESESNAPSVPSSSSSVIPPSLLKTAGDGETSSSSNLFSNLSHPPTNHSSSANATAAATASIQKGKSASTTAGQSGGGSVGAPEKVFRFKDEHGGEARTVFVDIPQATGTGSLLGRRATHVESILGIIPGHFSTPALQDSLLQHTSAGVLPAGTIASGDRIMVAGFVPDSVASRYRQIKIGKNLHNTINARG